MSQPISPTETDVSLDSSVPTTPSSSRQNSIPTREDEEEYYLGLPSSPALVYRTAPWTKSTGSRRESKELRPVFGHRLNTIWMDLGPKVCDILDSAGLKWTTIDVVRFMTKVGETKTLGPVVLWIGVGPKTFFGEDARVAAHHCLDLLRKFEIDDVEIEVRESIYTRSAGPSFLNPLPSTDHPIAGICEPLTPTLGLSIAAQATPHIGGTGGLYLAEGGDSKRILLITARHVLFSKEEPNVRYVRRNNSAPFRKVLLLGTKAFDKLIESIETEIGQYSRTIGACEEKIAKLIRREADENVNDVEGVRERREAQQRLLNEANNTKEDLDRFRDEVMKGWSQQSHRVLGHVIHSPPIAFDVGEKGYTEDYAIIEVDTSKISRAFRGNVIDLGSKIPADEFKSKMYPHPSAGTTYKHPTDRLFRLQGLIGEHRMANPDMYDYDDERCIMVLKNGSATGVTIGRANGIFSITRHYFDDDTDQTSWEWCILPCDKESGPFSAPGDSGAIVADGCGRIGGLLTAGGGKTLSSDVSYATPLFWILSRLKDSGFPNVHLNPTLA